MLGNHSACTFVYISFVHLPGREVSKAEFGARAIQSFWQICMNVFLLTGGFLLDFVVFLVHS